MSGLFGLLQTGKRALIAQQTAQQVVGNNLSNVNTEGYSKRTVRFEQMNSIDTPLGQIGLGVNIANITRSRNLFVDQVYRRAQSDTEQWQASQNILEQIDAIFSDADGGGLGSILDQFFNSFQDLANDPESSQTRIAVRESGSSVVQTFNRLAANLRDQRQAINTRIVETVDEVNRIVQRIADLNKSIPTMSSAAGQPNDLLDERDRLIDELSKIMDIKVIDKGQRGVSIYAGSINLVELTAASELSYTIAPDSDGLTTTVYGPDGLPLNVSSGRLRGLTDLRDQQIPKYQAALDNLAKTIVERVNEVHSQGYTLAGETGYDFFDGQGVTAGTIALSPEVSRDAQRIAASSSSGTSGDNSVALRIAGLKDDPAINGQSLRDYYAALVTEVGVDGRTAIDNVSSHNAIFQQARLQREATTAVSLDEEMVDMIRYQQSYNAAARMIATVDSMLQSIINLK